jgi:hypothetical protein
LAGDSAHAAGARGYSVSGSRVAATAAGGMVAGLGGACLTLFYPGSWNEGISSGQGLIAVALVIFARWSPLRCVGAALLFGGGGFAAASLDTSEPLPDDFVVREVLEAVEPLPLQEQVQSLDVHSFNLFRTESTRASDTVESLLARLGVDDPAAASFLRREPTFRTQLLGRAGRNVTVEATHQHALRKLTARWAPQDDGTFRRLVIERVGEGRF